VSGRALGISLIACAALAGLLVWGAPEFGFSHWFRFTMVLNAAVIVFYWFKNRKRAHG